MLMSLRVWANTAMSNLRNAQRETAKE